MPIKGLTTDVQASFPRIGKLRKGGAKTDPKRPGPDLPYFRFTSERPDVQAAFEAAYAPEPAVINAFLPYADLDSNFDSWQERWVGGGLVHRCDGQTMTIWLGTDGMYHREPKPCDSAGLPERDRCKPVGRLTLVIPELLEAGHVGLVTMETHGKHDLISIQASLLAALGIRGQQDLRGILFRVYRVREKISTPMENGKRGRRDKWLVKIEPAAAWVANQLEGAKTAAMLQLPEPKRVDPDTGEINPPELSDIEPPDYDDGEFTEEPPADLAPSATPGIPEPPDEEAAKADLREKIRAVSAARHFSETQLEKWAQKNCQCSYGELTLDALLALADAIEAAQKAS